jgi:ubiquinol-cytochrome c reductase cytochrome c subunit
VAEAMITGPGQMPAFDLPEDDRNAIITYTDYLRTAENPGGLAIGGIGPVPEGFVAWLVGIGLLVLIVYLVGREWDRKGTPE